MDIKKIRNALNELYAEINIKSAKSSIDVTEGLNRLRKLAGLAEINESFEVIDIDSLLLKVGFIAKAVAEKNKNIGISQISHLPDDNFHQFTVRFVFDRAYHEILIRGFEEDDGIRLVVDLFRKEMGVSKEKIATFVDSEIDMSTPESIEKSCKKIKKLIATNLASSLQK